MEDLLQLTAELMRLPCNSEGCAHKVVMATVDRVIDYLN